MWVFACELAAQLRDLTTSQCLHILCGEKKGKKTSLGMIAFVTIGPPPGSIL